MKAIVQHFYTRDQIWVVIFSRFLKFWFIGEFYFWQVNPPLNICFKNCLNHFLAGHGMEWNGTEVLVLNMEDARMEWNGRF